MGVVKINKTLMVSFNTRKCLIDELPDLVDLVLEAIATNWR